MSKRGYAGAILTGGVVGYFLNLEGELATQIQSKIDPQSINSGIYWLLYHMPNEMAVVSTLAGATITGLVARYINKKFNNYSEEQKFRGE